MNATLTDIVCGLGWRAGLGRLLGSRDTTVLMCHGVPRTGEAGTVDVDVFERHVTVLKRQFRIVSPDRWDVRRSRLGRPGVMLTFGDAFRNNAEVVAPILRRHGVPVVFFVSSRHAEPGKCLWFAHLRGLERWFPEDGFEYADQEWDMTAPHRAETIRQLRDHHSLRPHPAAMYAAIDNEPPRIEDPDACEAMDDASAGMSSEQVADGDPPTRCLQAVRGDPGVQGGVRLDAAQVQGPSRVGARAGAGASRMPGWTETASQPIV